MTKKEREKMREAATAAQQVRPGTWVQWAESGTVGVLNEDNGTNNPAVFHGDTFIECELLDDDGEDEWDDHGDASGAAVIAEHVATSGPEAVLRLLDALDAAERPRS